MKVNEIEYVRPVFLDDTVVIQVFLESIGTKSFSLIYELSCNNTIKTRGRSVLVSFDFEQGTTTSISNELVQGLRKLDQKLYK